jgi:hypothetical protein
MSGLDKKLQRQQQGELVVRVVAFQSPKQQLRAVK